MVVLINVLPDLPLACEYRDIPLFNGFPNIQPQGHNFKSIESSVQISIAQFSQS
ncbi:MAG: hypothetical protein VYC82_00690 [Verrucomicrobiota bacterium]|nr:hypothetical protein [Verrucomicrobiota bacterium]